MTVIHTVKIATTWHHKRSGRAPNPPCQGSTRSAVRYRATARRVDNTVKGRMNPSLVERPELTARSKERTPPMWRGIHFCVRASAIKTVRLSFFSFLRYDSTLRELDSSIITTPNTSTMADTWEEILKCESPEEFISGLDRLLKSYVDEERPGSASQEHIL